MSEDTSIAAKYGAFFRRLCEEGFEDSHTGDTSQAFELTRIVFEAEFKRDGTFPVIPWTLEELVGDSDE